MSKRSSSDDFAVFSLHSQIISILDGTSSVANSFSTIANNLAKGSNLTEKLSSNLKFAFLKVLNNEFYCPHQSKIQAFGGLMNIFIWSNQWTFIEYQRKNPFSVVASRSIPKSLQLILLIASCCIFYSIDVKVERMVDSRQCN